MNNYDDIRKAVEAYKRSDVLAHSDDHLEHWGIKGQKWGVRRFQNEDGSLTPEGRERYLKTAEKAEAYREENKYKKAYKIIRKTDEYSDIKNSVSKEIDACNEVTAEAKTLLKDYNRGKFAGKAGIVISFYQNNGDPMISDLANSIEMEQEYPEQENGLGYYFASQSPEKQKALQSLMDKDDIAENNLNKAVTNAVLKKFGEDVEPKTRHRLQEALDDEINPSQSSLSKALGFNAPSKESLREMKYMSRDWTGDHLKKSMKQSEKVMRELDSIAPYDWYRVLGEYADYHDKPVSQLTSVDWARIRKLAGLDY